MWTVKEVSRLSGVSIRTLHHYDTIGLLKPPAWTQAGYRLYDEAALRRLQSILLLRELQFPLKEIKSILDDCGCDPAQALEHQICLLQLQRDRLDRLIAHAREIEKTGGIPMDYTAFNTEKIDRYAKEAKAKWGNTEAYKEFETKTAGKDMQETGDKLMDIFRQFGEVRHLSPACAEAQALVAKLQEFITANYYNCTTEILFGLGQMYAAPGEMNENIDKAGGAGTGVFARDAITIYCK